MKSSLVRRELRLLCRSRFLFAVYGLWILSCVGCGLVFRDVLRVEGKKPIEGTWSLLDKLCAFLPYVSAALAVGHSGLDYENGTLAQRSLLDRPATVHLVRWALEVLLLMPVVLIPLPAMTADAAAVVLPAFLCLWVIMVSFALFFSLLAAMTRSPLAAACGIPVWMLVEKFLGSFLGYHCTVNTVLMGMMKADASMIWGSAGKTVAFAGLLFAALVLFYVIRYRKER